MESGDPRGLSLSLSLISLADEVAATDVGEKESKDERDRERDSREEDKFYMMEEF